ALRQAQKGYCIISGFQSEIESKVLDTILANGGYAIMVLANSIFKKCPPKYKTALDEERLLIISFFRQDQIKVTRKNAEIRNRKVIELADNIVVGCIKRNGMTENLIKETNKPCFILDQVRKK
ncbi:MAG: DNA-processing protein DprA, partial [Clostridia bacterium]|nr:DNA-processing protein DprA [Clostridia bacterium]